MNFTGLDVGTAAVMAVGAIVLPAPESWVLFLGATGLGVGSGLGLGVAAFKIRTARATAEEIKILEEANRGTAAVRIAALESQVAEIEADRDSERSRLLAELADLRERLAATSVALAAMQADNTHIRGNFAEVVAKALELLGHLRPGEIRQ